MPVDHYKIWQSINQSLQQFTTGSNLHPVFFLTKIEEKLKIKTKKERGHVMAIKYRVMIILAIELIAVAIVTGKFLMNLNSN
jgi:hypothetical protein